MVTNQPAGMNATQSAAWSWLIRKGNDPEDLHFQRRRTPDFIHADGRSWEVKLVRNNAVALAKSQVTQLKKLPKTVLLLWEMDGKQPVAQIKYLSISPPCRHGLYQFSVVDFDKKENRGYDEGYRSGYAAGRRKAKK